MSTNGVRRLRAVLAAGLPVGVVVVTALLAAARWPAYWQWIAAEQTPMTFVQAALLLSAAIGSALLALLAAVSGARRGATFTWLVLAAGFAALMLDERFALHERLRDGYLARSGVALPWGAPGDYLLVVYAAAGIVVLPRVLRLLAGDGLARGLFVAGVVLAVAVVAADSFDIERLSLAAQRAAQSLEELAEGLADAVFAAALWVHAVHRVARVAADTVTGELPAATTVG